MEGNEFGLFVRFTLRDGAGEAFDTLVRRTIEKVKIEEPGTLVYTSHKVQERPNQRIFYELYRDRNAFEEHERQPHTREFLASREQYVESVEVDSLTVSASKNIT